MFDGLDRRIRIERNTPVQDEYGQETENWSELVTLHASWRRASTKETLASAEVSATASDVFEIRWSPAWSSVNPRDRLVFDGRVYDISAVTEIGRREGLRINALARTE